MTAEPAKFVSRSEATSSPAPPVIAAADPESGPLVPVPVDIRSAAITVIAVIAGILLLQYAQAVFIPLVLGLLISYALDPVVTRQAFGAGRADAHHAAVPDVGGEKLLRGEQNGGRFEPALQLSGCLIHA